MSTVSLVCCHPIISILKRPKEVLLIPNMEVVPCSLAAMVIILAAAMNIKHLDKNPERSDNEAIAPTN